MLTDLLMFVLIIIGVITLGFVISALLVYRLSPSARRWAEDVFVHADAIRAKRRIHDVTSYAFQQMLDEARRHKSPGAS